MTSQRKKKRPHLSMLSRNQKEELTVELGTPTSVSMMNSFIIKNADPSFDVYYQ